MISRAKKMKVEFALLHVIGQIRKVKFMKSINPKPI